jgi:PAS domain S-box-containing protein
LVRGDIFRKGICQLLATGCLLFWHSTGFSDDLPISATPSRLSYLYWFLALLLCLLAGYFMGSRRRVDEENYQEAIENKLSSSDLRLKRQQAALAALTTDQLKDWQNPEEIFREITQISAETLGVERVSIWLFSDDNQQLECMDLYLKSKNLHTIAQPLLAKNLPEYFKFISQHRVIVANDIMQHPSTSEFAQGYAQENNVGALLDGTIWLNNKVIGVICHECVGSAREWTLDEQSFAGSVADLVRLTIEADRRRKAEADLHKHQKDLEQIIESRTKAIDNNAKIFQFLVERAPVAILYANQNNEIIEMNPEAERMSGYSREYAIGKTYDALFSSAETKAHNQKFVQKMMQGGKLQGEELLVKRADGSTIELSVSRSVELDSDGNTVIISIGQDVSQQKALEANALKLLETEKRFSYVVEHAPIPILILNNAGDIVEANPEAEAAAGYGPNGITGKNFIELIVSKESRRKAILTAAEAMKGKYFRNVELILQNAEGGKIEYECSLGSATQETIKGQRQLVAIARNVSNQKALEASLIKAREAAESADRIKSMFVASMSHELRTPLNSIIGFLGVVLQGMSGELNLKQKDQLGRAYHSARHLLVLISDVIDISKIEAGFLNAYPEKFELKPLLKEVEQAVQHIADEKQLALSIDCPAKLMLETDRKRLYQVMLNIVSNALKYTEHGFVKIKASIKNEQLIIAVKDTGIGIDETGLTKLFKPFERIESRLRNKVLGTGLGLYLTRKILSQLLGGTIEAKSKPEQGSIFTIAIPIKMPELIMQANASILEEPHSAEPDMKVP